MEYKKRKYRDVKDTFEYEYSGRSFFIKWTTVGVNELGIWLQPWSNDQPYGFFEWKWIKEILISEGNGIFFVMYDMDAVYKNVILWRPKIAFKINISTTTTGDKAVTMQYRNDFLAAVHYASEKGWAKVISIE